MGRDANTIPSNPLMEYPKELLASDPDFRLIPTPQSITAARNDLSRYDAEAESMDQKLQEAQAALTKLKAERDALAFRINKVKCFISPARRLPREVLEEIFRWSTTEETPLAPFVFSRVCSFWRQICLTRPALFHRIRITSRFKHPWRLLKLWLDRIGSKGLLDISIEYHLTYSSQEFAPIQGTVEQQSLLEQLAIELAEAMYRLAELATRWEKFSFAGYIGSSSLLPIILSKAMVPSLTHFTIMAATLVETKGLLSQESSHWYWLQHHAPKLQHLSILNIPINWSNISMRNLKVLHLVPPADHPGTHLNDIITILQANQNLEDLWVGGVIKPALLGIPVPSVTLSKLLFLNLVDPANKPGTRMILERISAPHLQLLCLDFADFYLPAFSVSAFLSRSGVPAIKKFGLGSSRSGDIGRDISWHELWTYVEGINELSLRNLPLDSMLFRVDAQCISIEKLILAEYNSIGSILSESFGRQLISFVTRRNEDGETVTTNDQTSGYSRLKHLHLHVSGTETSFDPSLSRWLHNKIPSVVISHSPTREISTEGPLDRQRESEDISEDNSTENEGSSEEEGLMWH
ncbi:hypothetical protein FRC03_008201 [Tulasnella sp. 419]|nr:hypothetical protein FRC03_008201 [Tulasnella sp. 419]